MGSGGVKSEPPPPVKSAVESPSRAASYSITSRRGNPVEDRTPKQQADTMGADSLLMSEDDEQNKNLIG